MRITDTRDIARLLQSKFSTERVSTEGIKAKDENIHIPNARKTSREEINQVLKNYYLTTLECEEVITDNTAENESMSFCEKTATKQ